MTDQRTPEELNAQFVSPADLAAAQAVQNRKYAYPSVTNQLDMLWHMMDSEAIPGKGSDWYNAILAIKLQFPKS